ncbi:MAG: hypothetical protein ACLP9L_18225 [Thermoguttaceae bacterium]
MISFGPGKYVDESAKVSKAVRKAGWDALRRLGFLIRGVAQASIVDEKGPSTPPQPPHTHKHQLTKKGKPRKQGQLPASILYGTPSEGPPSVIVGPSVNVVGTVGKVLEEGGERKKDRYEPRPFMAPALAAEIGELPGLLAEKLTNL